MRWPRRKTRVSTQLLAAEARIADLEGAYEVRGRELEAARRHATTRGNDLDLAVLEAGVLRQELATVKQELADALNGDPLLPGVTADRPHGAHQSCANAAARICDHCRPVFGYDAPTPAHPTPGATR